MRTTFATFIIGLLLALNTTAQTVNTIYQHNLAYQDPNDPNVPNGYYYAILLGSAVQIYHGIEGQPFQFEAGKLGKLGTVTYFHGGNRSPTAPRRSVGNVSCPRLPTLPPR